jgi:hypothetical protein
VFLPTVHRSGPCKAFEHWYAEDQPTSFPWRGAIPVRPRRRQSNVSVKGRELAHRS